MGKLRSYFAQPGAGLKLAMFVAVMALASQAEALGGLDKAKATSDEANTGMYALVGSVSGLYLLYLGLMAKMERKTWMDFAMGVGGVAVVGATIVVGPWAWGLFTGS